MTRILHSGDPSGDDFRDAAEWVKDVRSRLTHIRGELEDIHRIESRFTHDGLCGKVAGSLTLALIALHGVVEGDHGFIARAQRDDELRADVKANPHDYEVLDFTEWDWRPRGTYKRGGENA